MPNNIIKAFAKTSKKSETEVESLWNKAKDITAKEYPEIEQGSDKFYKLITGILKKMLSIKTENDGGMSITTSDVSAGTMTGLTKYHKQKRKLRESVNSIYANIPIFNTTEIGVFNALAQEGNNMAITMLNTAISSNQLKESIQALKINTINSISENNSLQYLNSAITTALTDKQQFAAFAEEIVEYLINAKNLNEHAIEFPGYDLIKDNLLVSVKSSSSRHTVSEAYRSSNSIKTSALILSALYRYDKALFNEVRNFKDISDLLKYKKELISFVEQQESEVAFSVSYLTSDDILRIHLTDTISEAKVLSYAFKIIQNNTGKAKLKFFNSYKKLVKFTEGEKITSIKLSKNDTYANLRSKIIESISNIKDYELMKKIDLLLQ